MKRYWVSWVCTQDDYQPLNQPPNKDVLGWWCVDNGPIHAVICALIQGHTLELATKAVVKEWPQQAGFSSWKCFKSVANDFLPGNDFPLEDWMEERI